MSILVADDDSAMRSLVSDELKEEGYCVVQVSDGLEVLHCLSEVSPDLVITDVMMPKMDGLQACQQLRQREETKAIPIFMVTTRGEAEKMTTAYERGCTDYITKPISGLELMTKVRSVLGD